MIVLGITDTSCATAALVRDGVVMGCASEERFTRLRNDAGYPRLAIDAVLSGAGVTPPEIDLVALAGTRALAREWLNRMQSDDAYARAHHGVRPDLAGDRLRRGLRRLGARLGTGRHARGGVELTEAERRAPLREHLGIEAERITAFDHHTCHAAAAYFGSPFAGAAALVLTSDSGGDGLCATASTGSHAGLARHEATASAPGSLGSFASIVSLLLGMRLGEDEGALMDLAAHAPGAAAARAAALLRETFAFEEGPPTRFAWRSPGPRYRQLLEATLGLRFDAIAGGAQRLLEDALLRWTRLMRARHGGARLALGGGVFMNARAIMRLATEDWVEELFVFPSCGDEASAVGAAYLGYRELCALRGVPPKSSPFGSPYLGPVVEPVEVEALIRARDLARRYRVTEHERVETRVAELLVRDGVVARCAGRLEFGAHALGNRSIVAHPSDRRVVDGINAMIQGDFWRSFAPSVLQEREGDYLVNPKRLLSPYMMLAFPTVPSRRDELAAAIHPRDFATPAHIVEPAWNPGYHAVLSEFERLSGVGAVLNAPLALHGEPIVCSAADAVDVFERSGLPHLALDRWIISRK